MRKEIISAICDAFTSENIWSVYHPGKGYGWYRDATKCVRFHKDGRVYGFGSCSLDGERAERFTEEEMRAAVERLKSQGYKLYKFYEYGEWLGYVVGKHGKPGGVFGHVKAVEVEQV